MSCELFISIGAAIIGIAIVAGIIKKRLRYYNFENQVDSTYWGMYDGAPVEPIPQAKIKLHKISFKQIITVGGQAYAKGMAVKSARAK
jgi:hypothetical protein